MQKPTDEDVAISVRRSIFDFLKFKLRGRDDAGKMLAVHYLEQKCWQWFRKLHRRNKENAEYKVTSRLVSHAVHEFSLLPKEPNQADNDLQEWLQEGVLDLLFILSQQGHSGGTMFEMMRLFNQLAAFKPLSPITDNPEEWVDMSKEAGKPYWQNNRDALLMSEDGGATYINVDNADLTQLFTSNPYVVQTAKD